MELMTSFDGRFWPGPIWFASASACVLYWMNAEPPTTMLMSVVQSEPQMLALPVTSVSLVTFVWPRTMMRPSNVIFPLRVRLPSTIRMPWPVMLPFPLNVTSPVKCVISGVGAGSVFLHCQPGMLDELLTVPELWVCTPGSARRSATIRSIWAAVGAPDDVATLGMSGFDEKPSPVTSWSWLLFRLLIASCVFVLLRVEMPGTGAPGPAVPVV